MNFMVANVSQVSCDSQVTGETLTGDQEDLEFFVIQTLTGEVVRRAILSRFNRSKSYILILDRTLISSVILFEKQANTHICSLVLVA